jgi:hypothetical protein
MSDKRDIIYSYIGLTVSAALSFAGALLMYLSKHGYFD